MADVCAWCALFGLVYHPQDHAKLYVLNCKELQEQVEVDDGLFTQLCKPRSMNQPYTDCSSSLILPLPLLHPPSSLLSLPSSLLPPLSFLLSPPFSLSPLPSAYLVSGSPQDCTALITEVSFIWSAIYM